MFDLPLLHNTLSELSLRPFVTFIEENSHEGEVWRFYIPLKGNEEDLKALEKDITTEDGYCKSYTIDWNIMPEYEVDILVKHGEQGYIDYHNKLYGRLYWRDHIETRLFVMNRDDIIYKIMNNFENFEMSNKKYFEKFDPLVIPDKYLLLKTHVRNYITHEKQIKRTVIQYNGNEAEIDRFLNDWNDSGWYTDEYNIHEFIEVPNPEDQVHIGKFNFTKIFNQRLIDKRDHDIHELLYKGKISDYVFPEFFMNRK